MKTLITLILITISSLAYSQEYVQDTLGMSDRGFLIRYTVVADTSFLSQEVEQLRFELDRISEESDRLIIQEKEVRKKLAKYEKVLKSEKDKKDSKLKDAKAQSIGYKERY